MQRNSAVLILVATTTLLSGCADYLNRYDTVTLAAGNTQKHNMLLQTADPFNPAAQDNHIPTNGNQVAAVLLGGPPALPPPAAPGAPATVGAPGGGS